MAKKNSNLPPFVETVKGSGQLHYKRDVPADVQAALAKIEGREKPRTRWSQSLKTADQREAARLARLLAAEHQRLIDAARKRLNLTAEERERIDDEGGEVGFIQSLAERALDAASLRTEAEILRGLIDDGEAHPDLTRARIAAAEAEAASIGDHLNREVSLIDKVKLMVPTPYPLAKALEALPADVERATLGAIFEAWKAVKKPVAANQFEVPVREFERLHGPLLLSQIEKKHVRQFRDHLAVSDLKESTGAKHLRCIGTLLKYARDDGFIDASPAEGIQWRWEKKKISESSAESRRTLTVAEVKALLAKADSLPKDRAKQDVAWFLRVLLWTGARPEEIAQSSPADVAELHGVWCLRIHDQGDRELKNRSSLRDVPIHPKLIEAGFLAFVEARKGGELLFASLKADGRGRVYQRMQRRLSRLIRGVISDERVVPYSFRHTFRDMLRVAEVPADVGDRLMGHTSPGRKISEGYGGAQIVVLAKWVAMLDPLDEGRTVSGFEVSRTRI